MVLAAGLAVLGCAGGDGAPDGGPSGAAAYEPAAPMTAATATEAPAVSPTAPVTAAPTVVTAAPTTAGPATSSSATASEPAAVVTAAPPTASSTTSAPTVPVVTVPPPVPTVASESGVPRLLTGLVADVAPGGVTLRWAVDETRAQRITGFSCVYRSPGHIRLGVSGAVGCPSGGPVVPEDRSATLVGLPEFGHYDFEVVAQVASGSGPAIYWGERALRLRVAVTEDLAGPPGPAQAVSGTGPIVTGCGPGDGPGVTATQRPWRLDQIVSDTHLTHYPGRGWSTGGDAHTPPDWPEPLPLSELLDEAGLDGDVVQQVADDTSEEQQAAAAALLADERGAAVVALLSARTKALLRPGAGGGWELRLHSGYPFGADYVYEPAHAVAGWGDPAHPTAWPALFERTDCPPPSQPDATHDVALALADTAAAGRLVHSGYGWWVVAPVGLFPERIVATQGGLSFGDPAAEAPTDPGARWQGRLSGHMLWDRQRWAVAGDASFELVRRDGELRLVGRIDGVVLSPLDIESLAPAAGPPVPWRKLTLQAGPAGSDGRWSGEASVTTEPDTDPETTASDDAGGLVPEGELEVLPLAVKFAGDWQAAAYGPAADEIAGRLRLWTPLADDADPSTDWPAQAVLVAGFGAERTP